MLHYIANVHMIKGGGSGTSRFYSIRVLTFAEDGLRRRAVL